MLPTRSPKVSIIIPLYNHEKFIGEAIQSVLEQSFSALELIVINDGSTDKSDDVVKSIQDKRLRYIVQENKGAPETINRGIHLAQGEYIGILNSDDVYHVNRVEKALELLESDRDLSAVFSHVECIDEEGKSIRIVRGLEENWKPDDPSPSFQGTADLVVGLLAGNCLLTTSNLICRRAVFDAVGYFREFRYAHDYDFFLRLCSRVNATILDTPLLRYRIHGGNTVKESEADVSFEIGLILAGFLLEGHRDVVFGHEGSRSEAILKLFNSIDTRYTDRMIMVLLLSGLANKDETKVLFDELMRNPEHPFRKRCVESFRSRIDLWRSSQEAWKVWSETNDRLLTVLAEGDRLRSSKSYRLGRAVTWPLRKLFRAWLPDQF